MGLPRHRGRACCRGDECAGETREEKGGGMTAASRRTSRRDTESDRVHEGTRGSARWKVGRHRGELEPCSQNHRGVHPRNCGAARARDQRHLPTHMGSTRRSEERDRGTALAVKDTYFDQNRLIDETDRRFHATDLERVGGYVQVVPAVVERLAPLVTVGAWSFSERVLQDAEAIAEALGFHDEIRNLARRRQRAARRGAQMLRRRPSGNGARALLERSSRHKC